MANTYFAGGNSQEGFCSFFEDILAREKRGRAFYLKGGPGVGKSSLMRRMAAALEKAGQETELFLCSGDPESLDAVTAPCLGLLLVDGTAPHVLDPRYPGAQDTLVSLGDYLDEPAMRPRLPEIRRLNDEIAARYRQAYAYLAAAGRVLESALQEPDESRTRHMAGTLCDSYLPLRGGMGASRRLFADAITHQGVRSLTDTLARDTAVSLKLSFGQSADRLLRLLAEKARLRGLDVLELRDPLRPQALRHLYLPAHRLLFTSDAAPDAKETIPAEGLFLPQAKSERELGFDRNVYELLAVRATEQLKAAKALHDELESHYAPHMDFLRWQERLDGLLAELGLA